MADPEQDQSLTELAGDNVGKILFLSLVAALGGFLFGFDSGVINGTVDALQTEFGSDDVGTGFNVASILLGSAVGAFFAGNVADRFGRRLGLRHRGQFAGVCLLPDRGGPGRRGGQHSGPRLHQ